MMMSDEVEVVDPVRKLALDTAFAILGKRPNVGKLVNTALMVECFLLGKSYRHNDGSATSSVLSSIARDARAALNPKDDQP